MAKIEDELRDSNPWWKGEFRIEYKERDIYKRLSKFLSLPQIIALTGLRRVGKTTIMLKLVEDYIKNGFEPKNILYFPFDEFKEIEIRGLLGEYERLVEKNIGQGRFLLLFDEIQKLRNWEDQLKRIYDLYRNTKIIISGSESLFLRKKSKETLAGRMFEFKINPLSFKEFLKFKGVEFQPTGIYEKELRKLFNEFTLTMGFPELIGITDREIIKKYVGESIVEKIIYRDIPQLFEINNVEILKSVLNTITEEPGQLIEVSHLANELGISRQTASNYLNYLGESFLIIKLYNFSKNRRKVERKLKKYYPAILSPNLLFNQDDHSRSRVLEWLAITQLNAEFFWRDPYKNEVDAVIGEKPVPIEVKYGRIDTSGLLAFMKKFNVKKGYILSSEREEKIKVGGKVIEVVPLFKFLLNFAPSFKC
ncbi:MAG: ATP-binding protein [Candidatus Freyarchaeota archaeon]